MMPQRIHILGFVLVFTVMACRPKTPPYLTGKEGQPLPSFNLLLPDSSGYINSWEIFSGHPVIFFYYGTSCPYCQAETEDIIAHMKELQAAKFCFLTDAGYREMKEFNDRYHLDKYKNVMMGTDTGRIFSSFYKAPGFPMIALVNKNKKMEKAFMGVVKSKDLQLLYKEI